MQTPLNTILNLLIESPGNIIYHLALAFSIISCFQAALITRHSRKDANVNRLVLGLGMLLFGQAVLYIFAGLAWQNVIDQHDLMPPLDRAVTMFSVIWIIWLWVFPQPARLGDLVTGFLNLGVVILFLFTYTSWSQDTSTQHFNATWMDMAWELTSLFLVITGMALLLFSHPPGWEFGIGMLSLMLAGFVAHLLFAPDDEDYSGYVRLAFLAAFPLLPTLLNRLTIPAATSTAPAKAAPAAAIQSPYPRSQDRRRYSADPRTVHAWLALSTLEDPAQVPGAVTRALAHTLLADLCFLVYGPANGQIIFDSGFNLISEEPAPGTSIDQVQLPALSSSLQRGKNLAITPDNSQAPDMKIINSALGLTDGGSLLFIPLAGSESPNGILFLSPYSNRQWSADDQGFLSSEIEIIGAILHQHGSQAPLEPTGAVVSLEQARNALSEELEILRHDNQVLLIELSEYRQNETRKAVGMAAGDITALVALQQEAQDQINALQAENERLQTLLAQGDLQYAPPEDMKRLEQELRESLQDIATLHNHLAEANARNMILERANRQLEQPSNEDLEVITSVVQEIRQPMSSINGYTELLLSETVGLLGALQRKFLERILASTERMRFLLDDLIRVTTISEGPVELMPQPVDLSSIIDGAINDVSGQLREKNIGMQVDLPEQMPQILADRDAIQQIILHLLQNASSATPQDDSITLRARVQEDQQDNYLLLQVTDKGGGVRSEDLPRVFARHYRADKPLIQGLGDTGVGLSIAKTLVEAHGGRIWVDSSFGQSTTFSVLLPLSQNVNGNSGK
jgi:signal transduction histidine kinase